jgi:hypothetical protein
LPQGQNSGQPPIRLPLGGTSVSHFLVLQQKVDSKKTNRIYRGRACDLFALPPAKFSTEKRTIMVTPYENFKKPARSGQKRSDFSVWRSSRGRTGPHHYSANVTKRVGNRWWHGPSKERPTGSRRGGRLPDILCGLMSIVA